MHVQMFCDGGSRGNPGVAGSGSVVYGPDGETLAEVAYVVGKKSSNNVAEYYGLIRGLEAAAELGATRVDVSMDSKLVVEQMTGRWKIKHPDMQKLAREARDLAKQFEKVTYAWVPRAKNKKADELSNVAMDAAAEDGTPRILEASTPSRRNSASDLATSAGASSAEEKAEFSRGKGTHQTASPSHWAGQDAPRTRFVLLRHGQTAHSAERRYSGTSDPELTEVGQAQARRAATTLATMGKVDVIVTSPQRRARQTAAACAEALGVPEDAIEVVEDFRELDFGAFEGLTRQEAQERDPDAFGAWEASASEKPPSGESLAQLHRRVTRARLMVQKAHEGKTVLVVTHMTPIKSVIRQALGTGAETFRHIFLDLASVSVVEFYGDFGVVRTFNDVAHHRQPAS
ncbi:bifunctional RNase H/acid phosphatase [Corynebacterium sp. TA-R-1]|uniref:Bifunctional RNase H/acid phosphatase n=1 Tax=Corynebacterium stercoris TaxID=2943490 RepID=A0ABT1FYI0_9CORY|nr:bifunctional RNase H/acid phosphatase [Corynebacterium stercoris]MCP1386786.1 bifunctional RNase H/acid phosphatase [Corynebacterium stercoris]